MHAVTAGPDERSRLWPKLVDLYADFDNYQSWTDREIPVVVLSADATPGQTKRLLADGAREFLTKPLDVTQLLRVLDEVLLDATLTEGGR